MVVLYPKPTINSILEPIFYFPKLPYPSNFPFSIFHFQTQIQKKGRYSIPLHQNPHLT